MCCSAAGPYSDQDLRRTLPPTTIKSTCSLLANSKAIFKALVITTRSFLPANWVAIWLVVEPESRMIASPSFTNAAAAQAMANFTSRLMRPLSCSGRSKANCLLSIAPP
ncbi:hypothetical protein D3C76_1650380 [compost metagenome]